MKNVKKIILIIVIIILLLGSAFSIYKFQVVNPISSCFGMIEMLYTDKPYTVVQNTPKRVLFINVKTNEKTSEEVLDEYMKKRGFSQSKYERMGAELVYKNGYVVERVILKTNAYYTKCVWR